MMYIEQILWLDQKNPFPTDDFKLCESNFYIKLHEEKNMTYEITLRLPRACKTVTT